LSKFEWLPKPIRNILRQIRNGLRSRALESLAHAKHKKIVIGSSGTRFDGWVSTDQEVLDLIDTKSWASFFEPNSLDAILAEHVWEHLHPHEAATAAMTCYTFLKPGGYLRVAVPDGFHPDRSYIDAVRPGGTGAGADDHKVLYTYASFRDLFVNSGFDVHLQEYFDERGQFHCSDWNPSEGMIQRSKRFDPRNSPERLAYTSIILDAIKPNTYEVPARQGVKEIGRER
jgi:predicted SAM-dependent methyltransferase